MQIEKYFFRWKKMFGKKPFVRHEESQMEQTALWNNLCWNQMKRDPKLFSFLKKKSQMPKINCNLTKKKCKKWKWNHLKKQKLQKIEKTTNLLKSVEICWNLLKSVEICWKQGFQQISTDFIFSNFGCFFFPCFFFFCGAFVLFSSGSPLFFVNFGLEIDVFCVSLFLVLSWYLLVLFFFVSLVLLLLLICCFVFFSGFAFSHTLVSDFAWLFSRSMFSCRTILAQSFVSATAIKH